MHITARWLLRVCAAIACSPAAIAAANPAPPQPSTDAIDLPPVLLENSPTLQRWLEDVPDVHSEIRSDPSFRTRLRVGVVSGDGDGLTIGVEDVQIGTTRLTLSGDYQRDWQGDRQSFGADLRYSVRPLGSRINLSPVVGYRRLEIDEHTVDGVNVGLRLLLSLSRTGAADVSLTQTWVDPGGEAETGITTLSFGYALTPDLRLSTDLQQQNSPYRKDDRLGILLEWML